MVAPAASESDWGHRMVLDSGLRRNDEGLGANDEALGAMNRAPAKALPL